MTTSFDLLGYFFVVFYIIAYIEIEKGLYYIISYIENRIEKEDRDELYYRAVTVISVTVIFNFIYILIILYITKWL